MAAAGHEPTWPEVCSLLAAWTRANLPGGIMTEVRLTYADGRRLKLPFTPGSLPAPPQPANQPSTDWVPPEGDPEEETDRDDEFYPTDFQERILDALNGKALRVDALGAAAGDRSRLYKPGGLKELRKRGMVMWNSQHGFYRPDAPPPDLESA